MSMPKNKTVNCAKCGTPLSVTVFQSVNTDYAEDIAQQIITGQLFAIHCPKCGFDSHFEYDMLYHDMKHMAMVWVIHNDSPEYKKRVSEVRSTNIIPNMITRIVNDVNSLREKVACLENNRDDRIIELCKVFSTYNLLEKQPEFDFRNAFYSTLDGKEVIFIYDTDGKEWIAELSEKAYGYLNDLYFSSEYVNQFEDNYAVVDYPWAEQILIPLIEIETKRLQSASSVKDKENAPANNILMSDVVEDKKAIEAAIENPPHNELDTDFGLVSHKPVYTVGIDETEKYLNALRTINGEPINWNHRGSMSVDGISGMVDVYDSYLPSGKEYKTIYINMHGTYNSDFSPKGFSLLGSNALSHQPILTQSTKQKSFLISTTFLWILFVGALLTLSLAIATAIGQNINYDASQDAWNHHQATLTDKTVGCGSYGCSYCRGVKTSYSYNKYGYPDFRDLFAFYAENINRSIALVNIFDISVFLCIIFSIATVILFIIRHRQKSKKILNNIFKKKDVALIIISLILLASLIANGILAYNVADYKRVYEFHRDKAAELEEESDRYYKYWLETLEQVSFFNKVVVFVEDDGTNQYHKYSCDKFKGNYFWAFNIEAAKDKGYTACPDCH